MRKLIKWAVPALAVCAAVLIWSALEIRAVGSDLQYLIPAPAIETGDSRQGGPQTEQEQDTQTPAPEAKPNAKALALWKSLQTTAEGWDGIIQSFTLSGIAEGASFVSDANETKQARLIALGPDAFTLAPEYLLVGRLFYPEELANGSGGILLDEQLALALFRVAEPIGRTVTIADEKFTVIGVLRHTKKVGDGEDYAAYVPLSGLWDQAIQLNALQVTARPVPGAGANAKLKTDLENWQAGGTLIDLRKEGMGALMPLRALLFFCGCAVFFCLLGVWIRRLRFFIGDTKERLRHSYAMKLMPRMLAGTLALALGLGALGFVAAMLVTYIVAPVYTFPEWVPAVLVEWEDIRTAFWRVWQSAASLMELRSPELIRIRYFGMLTGWFSAAAALLFTGLWVRWRTSTKKSGKPR